MLLRWDPFRELDRIAEQPFGQASSLRAMPIDAFRRDGEFFVHLDLPGVQPDSIELTVEKNVVTVKAERDWQPAEGDEVVIAERPRGTFTRQLFLGDNLDATKLGANYEHGVLTLTIPGAEAAKPRRVEVGTAANGSGEQRTIEATSSAA